MMSAWSCSVTSAWEILSDRSGLWLRAVPRAPGVKASQVLVFSSQLNLRPGQQLLAQPWLPIYWLSSYCTNCKTRSFNHKLYYKLILTCFTIVTVEEKTFSCPVQNQEGVSYSFFANSTQAFLIFLLPVSWVTSLQLFRLLSLALSTAAFWRGW